MPFLCYLRYSISLFISKLQSISEPWQPPINTTLAATMAYPHGYSFWALRGHGRRGENRDWTFRKIRI